MVEQQLMKLDGDGSLDASESDNRPGRSRYTIGEPFVLSAIASLLADDLNRDLQEAPRGTYLIQARVTSGANRLVMEFGEEIDRVFANLTFDSIDEGSALISVDIVGGMSSPGARLFAKALSRVLL